MRGPLAGGQVRMVRLAQDERGKTLFARGTAEELAQIDELVKALDVAPDKLSKCEVAGLYLIPLQRAEARSVASLLTQLGFLRRSLADRQAACDCDHGPRCAERY